MRGRRVSRKVIGIALAGLLVLLAGAYFLRARVEVQRFASGFVKRNPTVVQNFGPVRVALTQYNGRGPHGYAEYEILVSGDKAEGAVYLELYKPAGVWEVRAGNLVLEGREKAVPLVLGGGRSLHRPGQAGSG